MNIMRTKIREILLIGVIIIIGIVATLANENFLSMQNIMNVFNACAVMGIMSIGTMLVIATGNIDISVGAQFYALSFVCGELCRIFNGELGPVIILIAIVGGLILGSVNGFFVIKLKIPAIVVTLAMLSIIRGTMLLLTDGTLISGLTGPYLKIAAITVGPVYITPIVWMALCILTFIMIRYMRFGREILAVGGNEVAASRIGISKNKIVWIIFAIAGGLTGLAAGFYVSKVGTLQSSLGIGYEMRLIAAVVIGGTTFAGGIMSILGTLCGVLLMAFIDNMLIMMHVPAYWHSMTVGTVLLAAVIFSAFRTTGHTFRKNLENSSTEGEIGNAQKDG